MDQHYNSGINIHIIQLLNGWLEHTNLTLIWFEGQNCHIWIADSLTKHPTEISQNRKTSTFCGIPFWPAIMARVQFDPAANSLSFSA